ncbi:MAG: magnesium transporter [Bacteroidota bacterium]
MANEVTHQRSQRVRRVKRLISQPNARIRSLLRVLHPTEIAQVLEEAPSDLQKRIITRLPPDVISEAIAEMRDDAQPARLLTILHPSVAAGLIEALAPDDAADLLAQIPELSKEKILTYVPDEDEEELKLLLTYDEETAGGLMNPDVICVRANMNKLEALREVVQLSEEAEDFYTIYVTDDDDFLVGYITFKNLFKAQNSELVGNIMSQEVIFVRVDDDQEEVAKVMSRYNLPTLPVVDPDKRLIGRVTFDDILDVIEEETTEDILNFVGVSEGATLRGDSVEAFKSRITWLLTNLITASIAATVIFNFQDTIEEIVIVAIFMPIIAGVAGNGANQTLGVTIRRIATEGIPTRKAFQVILKELGVSVLNGLTIGTIVSLGALGLAFYRNDLEVDLRIGLVVFLAMCGNLIIGGLMGSFVPITLERIGVDPAIASSILITAFTDVLGYLLLFGLATLILL